MWLLIKKIVTIIKSEKLKLKSEQNYNNHEMSNKVILKLYWIVIKMQKVLYKNS